MTRASPLVASAFGQHRKFPPQARTTSGTQVSGGLSANENEKNLHRALIHLIISFLINPSFALSKCRITIQPSFSCSPFTSIGEKSEIRVYRNSFRLEGFVGNTRVDQKRHGYDRRKSNIQDFIANALTCTSKAARVSGITWPAE